VWSSALFIQDELKIPPQGAPHKLFDSRAFWRGPKFIHTRADPFLYVHEDELFLFFEVASAAGPGWIEGYRTADLVNFIPLGEVMREDFHIAYPSVFSHGEDIFMIPETKSANEVMLFKFNTFPYGLTKIRSILPGQYNDPTVFKVDGVWFLFATKNNQLHLFSSDDLLSGEFLPHRVNPVSSDPVIFRSGGMPVNIDGRLYRVAQNCKYRYGSNLSLIEITEISRTSYVERLAKQDIFFEKLGWNNIGSHHLSLVKFRNQYVLAVDGYTYDYYIHKLIGASSRLLQKSLGLRGIRNDRCLDSRAGRFDFAEEDLSEARDKQSAIATS
jgi:hypothetical protein